MYFSYMMERRYKVWIELDAAAVRQNILGFRALLSEKTKLYSVVKSNAYGHGLKAFSKIADTAGVDGFCVDSVVEGAKLREEGITKPILVLGYTLPALYKAAAERGITVTISNFEALEAWGLVEKKPKFHIKIDTGMHRQGFQLEDIPALITALTENYTREVKSSLLGIYTHFAMAKNREDMAFTEEQFSIFESVGDSFEAAGFTGLMRHASATGGTLLDKKFNLDMVRVGIGLYGIYPSEELERQAVEISLKPVLSLYSVISEIKNVHAGEGVGYDLTERLTRDSRLAVIPIGYWHGIPRDASSRGTVHVGAHTARMIGRVSMDMMVVDVTGIPCAVGDSIRIMPQELAREIGASPYEVVTRLNPLIHKDVVY